MVLLSAVTGCKQRFTKTPGESDIRVKKLEIVAADKGKELALPHEPLIERLGQRAGSLLTPDRYWSPFREAEDRRRIEAFWQQFGYFDVEVDSKEVEFDKEDGRAVLEYRVRENTRYKVLAPVLRSAPQEEIEALNELFTFKENDPDVDLERFRKVRIEMQEYLRRRGYGHANVYHRAYVDKDAKTIADFFFVDAGPKTVIASLKVDGNVKVPAADVLRRAGLSVGQPYQEDLRDAAVRDLLDTGAFAAAFVRVDTDTKFIAPGTAPDSGGELRDEQIDAEGNLIPRQLPAGVNVTVHVVESPGQTIRLRAGFEIDPSRADTILGAQLWLRDLFGPMHHLVIEGRAGYGWLFGTPSNDRAGFYGDGLIRTIHPGVLGRLGDVRTTIRYQSQLFPIGFLHRGTTGVGARTTFLKGLFLDVDLLAFFEKTEGFGAPDKPFLPEEIDRFGLPVGEWAVGPEIDSAFVWDGRDEPAEATRGGFVSIVSRWNPLSATAPASHPFFNIAPDVRGYIPLTKALSVALRASAEWSLLNEGDGIPLGERLFGGGNFGFRGWGAQYLSPAIRRCFNAGLESYCVDLPVGGRSLVESSVEVRFLPIQKQYGAVVFGDLGGASEDLNPFARGPSLAAGVGGRLRLWYLPAAIDFAYRILSEGEVQGLDARPFRVFFRIGEAF